MGKKYLCAVFGCNHESPNPFSLIFLSCKRAIIGTRKFRVGKNTKVTTGSLTPEWHSWQVRGLRCVRSRVRSPVTLHPCFNFSRFCVA